MATGTAGSTARRGTGQQLTFLRKSFVFGDNGTVLTIGTLPAGALIVKPISGFHVTTVFNAGTNNFLDLGTAANDDLFGTDVSLLTAGFVPLDEAVGDYLMTADTVITMTLALSGTAATTGAGEVVICFIPDNDG